MKLITLHESRTKWVYGYRSFPIGGTISEIRKLLIRDDHQEAYFSPKPHYYYDFRGKDGLKYANMVEVRFDPSDVNFGGFGDSQPFYHGLISNDQTGYQFIDKLPQNLQQQYLGLKQQIDTDPRKREDWSLAGCLPVDLKTKAVALFRQCRKVCQDLATGCHGEVNYVGPITSFGEPTGTTVTAIVIARQDDLKFHPETIVSQWHSMDSKLIP